MLLRYSHLSVNKPAGGQESDLTHVLTFRAPLSTSSPAGTPVPPGYPTAGPQVILPMTEKEAGNYELDGTYELTLTPV